MSDEFDEIIEPCFRQAEPSSGDMPAVRIPSSVPRLVARLYAISDLPLRARLIACLLRPLGPLGLAGVAAGAFAGFVNRHGFSDASVDLARAARISTKQIRELARFVEEVNPKTFQRFAALVSDSHLGLATFSASCVLLLYRALREPTSTTPPTAAVRVEASSGIALSLGSGAKPAVVAGKGSPRWRQGAPFGLNGHGQTATL